MPNTENINRLIEVLQKDSGVHFRMDTYIEYTPESHARLSREDRQSPTKFLECQTAMCLAGWANALSMVDEGTNYKQLSEEDSDDFVDLFGSESRAREWFGIEWPASQELFYLESKNGPTKLAFDKLAPEKRKAAGIRVLEILRDTGEVDWDQAIIDAGIGRGLIGWR